MSKAFDNVVKLNAIVSVTDYGAKGDGLQGSASANVTAIRAAIAAATAANTGLYVPAGVYVVNDNFRLTSANNGLTIYGDGFESCIKLADVTNTGVNINAGWMFEFEDAALPIKNVTIRDLQLDGSRATTTHITTSFGVRINGPATEVAHENILIENIWSHSFKLGEGIRINAPGVRINNVFCYNNEFHGIGTTNAYSGPFNGYVQIDNATCYDNDGYGIDISKGRAIIGVAECFRNTSGGMKTSENCYFLQADQLFLYDNTGPGYQCTGSSPDLEINIGYVEARNNGSNGVRLAHGKRAHITTARCVGNTGEQFYVTDAIGNGLTVDIDTLYVESPTNTTAVYVDNPGGIRIGYFEAKSCLQKALRVLSSVSNVSVLSGRLVDNNQNNTAGLAGACFDINSEFAVLENLVFLDTQSPATQTAGMFFGSGCQAYVDGCRFGTGIATNNQVLTSTAGTRVRFGRGNVGLVTYARGTYTANGGTTVHTATYPTPIANLGGAVLYAQMTPASSDASGAHYVSGNQVTVNAIRVDYVSATPAGTNNVSYRYEVEMEIQR